MADFSRDPRGHWLKPHFSKNEVAKSGRGCGHLGEIVCVSGNANSASVAVLYALEYAGKHVASRLASCTEHYHYVLLHGRIIS